MSGNNKQIIELMLSLHEKLDEARAKIDDKMDDLEKRIQDLELQVTRAKGAMAGVMFVGAIIGWLLSFFKIKLWG